MPPNMKKLKKQREDAKKRAAERKKNQPGKLLSSKVGVRRKTPLAGKGAAGRQVYRANVYGEQISDGKPVAPKKKPATKKATGATGTNKPKVKATGTNKPKMKQTRRGLRPVKPKAGPSNAGKYNSLAERKKRRKK